MAENQQGNNGYKRSYPTFEIGNFYNYPNGGTRLKVVVWSDRVGLVFSSFSQTSERNEETVWLSFDMLIALENIMKDIVIERVTAWKNKKPYKEFSYSVDNIYFDKDQNPHTTGKLFFRTIGVPEGEKGQLVNRVQIAWVGAKNSYEIVFGNKLMSLIIASSADVSAKVDPIDTALYRFAYTLTEITNSYSIYSVGSKLAEMINRNSGNSSYNSGRKQWDNKDTQTTSSGEMALEASDADEDITF